MGGVLVWHAPASGIIFGKHIGGVYVCIYWMVVMCFVFIIPSYSAGIPGQRTHGGIDLPLCSLASWFPTRMFIDMSQLLSCTLGAMYAIICGNCPLPLASTYLPSYQQPIHVVFVTSVHHSQVFGPHKGALRLHTLRISLSRIANLALLLQA